MNAAAGRSLAVWLYRQHPDLFVTLARRIPAAPRSGFGQVDPPTIDISVPDIPPPIVDISTIDVSQVPMPTFDITQSADTSGGGFLSSVGNALSSAVSGVGSFLTSSQGLSQLTGLASNYFRAQGATATAQTQQAIVNAQIARASSGQMAAPISYSRNPYTGALTPVIQTAAGYQPLNTAGLSQLMPSGLSSVVSQYGIWIAGAGLALVLLLAVSRR